jgi:hypothetical protein
VFLLIKEHLVANIMIREMNGTVAKPVELKKDVGVYVH